MVASAEGASEKMGGFRPEMGGARPLHFARPHIKHCYLFVFAVVQRSK